MSGALIELVYRSLSKENIKENELVKILSSSREHNKKQNITGMLTYDNNTFLQILEGEESKVYDLLGMIKQDPRHHNVELLYVSAIENRAFEQWAMAYTYFTSQQSRELIEKILAKHKNGQPKHLLTNSPNIGKEVFLLYREKTCTL